MYRLYSMYTIYCIVSHSLKRTIILHILLSPSFDADAADDNGAVEACCDCEYSPYPVSTTLPLRIFWKYVFSSAGTLFLEAPPTLSNMVAVLFLDSKSACHWTALSSERIFLVSLVSIIIIFSCYQMTLGARSGRAGAISRFSNWTFVTTAN